MDASNLSTVNVEQSDEQLPDTTKPDVGDIYRTMETYVRMAARGEKEGVLLKSRPGIGKSHQIQEILDEEVGRDDSMCWSYSFKSGYVSPLSLYETLYEEQAEGNVLVMDDVEGVASNESAAALLKAALEGQGSGDERWVEWDSKSSKLPEEVPERFQFRGSLIMIFNSVPDGNKHWEAVKSRCFDYEFTITYDERMDLIREVAKVPYEDLDYSERMEIANWLIDQTTSNMEHIDLRSLFHCFDLYRSTVTDDEEWKLRAAEQIGIDEEVILARESIENNANIAEAAEAFAETTRHPTKQFFDVLGEDSEVALVDHLTDEYETAKDAIDVFKELTTKSKKTFYRRRDELDQRTIDL